MSTAQDDELAPAATVQEQLLAELHRVRQRGPRARRRAPVESASPTQQRMWMLDQTESGRSWLTTQALVRLAGPLDHAALEWAFGELVRRNEVLRTGLVYRDDATWTVLLDTPAPAIVYRDVSAAAETARADEVGFVLAGEDARRFDLAQDVKVRMAVMRWAQDDHLLLLTVHHCACDITTYGLIFSQLGAAYLAYRQAGPIELPPLPLQYGDYAAWKALVTDEPVLETQRAYWRRQLGDLRSDLGFPADRAMPATFDTRAGSIRVVVPADVHLRLRALMQQEGMTLFSATLAVLQALLGRYCFSEDVWIGTTVQNRDHSTVQDLLGPFTNTVVIRTDLSAAPSFVELAARVADAVFAAKANADVPFDVVLNDATKGRIGQYNPLFQVAFQALRQPAAMLDLDLDLDALRGSFEPVGAPRTQSLFDVLVAEEESRGDPLDEHTLVVNIAYQTAVLDEATMQRFAQQYIALLDRVTSDPDACVFDHHVDDVDPAEALMALPSVGPGAPASIVDLVYAQAARTPDATAVVDREGSITYAQLTAEADRFAGYLVTRGVRRGDVVGVCHRRDRTLVTTLLAILRAGACYTAVDATYPAFRIMETLQQAHPTVVVTSPDRADAVPPVIAPIIVGGPLHPDALACEVRPAACEVGPEDVFNVIFTSGSTGSPSAVQVTHGGVSRLATGAPAWIEMGPGTRTMQMSPLTFDVSTFELWVPLCNGGATVAVDCNPLTDNLAEVFGRYNITTAHFVAPQLDIAVEQGIEELDSLRQIVVGGDVIRPSSLQAVVDAVPGRAVHCAYGPTETAVMVTTFAAAAEGVRSPVPLGRPLPGTVVTVRDDRGVVVPTGARGEICVSGPALSRGYLEKSAETTRAFVADPYGAPGTLMYRTGDLGHVSVDGMLHFAGRRDRQVKVRGFRVELAEVEQVLLENPAVNQAVAVVRGDHLGESLVAYVVGDTGLDPDELRRWAVRFLPPFEVPSVVVPMDAFPLTSSGKVDQNALPKVSVVGQGVLREPETAMERIISAIWTDLIGHPISTDSNFFANGGHSMLAVRATSRSRELVGREVPLNMVFDSPTVATYSIALEELARSTESLEAVQTGGVDTIEWTSTMLGNSRRIDIYRSLGFDPRAPGRLIVVLDGAEFVEVVRVPKILDGLVHEGRIPATAAVFVSHPNWETRVAEMSLGEDFARVILRDLVPDVLAHLGTPPDQHVSVVLVGASLGAVVSECGAMFVPDAVCGVVAMAGPYEWGPTPEREGELIRMARVGAGSQAVHYIFVGKQDRPQLKESASELHDALLEGGSNVTFATNEGGHTFTTWQENLGEAICAVLSASDPGELRG